MMGTAKVAKKAMKGLMIETKPEVILMILMIDFGGDCLLSEWVRWGEL